MPRKGCWSKRHVPRKVDGKREMEALGLLLGVGQKRFICTACRTQCDEIPCPNCGAFKVASNPAYR